MTEDTPRALFPAGAEIEPAVLSDSPIFFGMAMEKTKQFGPLAPFKITHATWDALSKRKVAHAAVYINCGHMIISSSGTLHDCLVPVAPMWDGAIQANTEAPVFEAREAGPNVAMGYLQEVFNVCAEAREVVSGYAIFISSPAIPVNAAHKLVAKLDAVLKPAEDFIKASGGDTK